MIKRVESWVHKSEKNLNRVIFALIPIIALLYSWKILFTDNTILPGGLDFPSYISSNLVHRRDILSGIFPLWNNMWSYGVPEYANPLTSLYYPPVFISFLLFGITSGLKVLIYLHLCMSGVFFWIFSKKLVQKPLSRFFGTMLYMLSGFYAGHTFAGHFVNLILTYPWIPLYMFTLYNAIQEKTRRHTIYCSVTLAVIVILGGYYLAYLTIATILFAITKSITYSDTNKVKLKVDWKNIRIFTEIAIFTFLFSAIKMIPVLFYSLDVNRTYDPLLGSMNLSEIIMSFIDSSQQGYGELTKDPYHFYESYVYIGVIPIILAGFSLFNRRKLSFYFLSLLTFIIWIQGFNTIFGFVHFIPFIKSYRVPSRAFYYLSFVVIVLAMSGFDWLYTNFKELSIDQQKKIVSFLGIFGVLIILEWVNPYLLDLLTSNDTPTNSQGFYRIAEELLLPISRQIITLGVVLLLLIVFFVYFIPKAISYLKRIKNPGKTLMFTVVLFSSINLLIVNGVLKENVGNPINSEIISRTTNTIKQDTDSIMKWTLLSGDLKDRGYYYELGLIAKGIPISNAYYPSSRAYNEQVSPSSFLINENQLSLHNYEITTKESDNPSDILIDSFTANESYGTEILLQGPVYVYRNNDSLPDAFIIRNQQLIQVSIREYSSSEILIAVDQGIAGDIVVVKVSYYPGWKVNGNEALEYQSMVATQIKFSEEYVSSKENQLFKFQFKPLDFKIGAFVSLVLSPILVIPLLTNKKSWNRLERSIYNLIFRRSKK